MADERKIVIIIKTDGETGSDQNVTGKPEDNKEDVSPVANKSQSVALAAFAAERLASAAVSEILSHAKYEIDKSLSLDDNYMAQRDMGIALQMLGKTSSVISSITGSAAAGAMIGGPVGAIVGGALGTVTSIASVARENFQVREQQEIMLRQMDAQLNFTRQRAGWSTKAASIGEDL